MISFTPLTKLLVAAALVSSSTAGIAQSAECQGTNCVLPLQGPAAPPPVEVAAPVEAAPIVETSSAKGLGLLPILIGAALAAVALYFILDEDEEGDEDPISA